MLVLSRKRSETVLITTPEGREIAVMVTTIEPGRVRLGITADKDVTIMRSELVHPVTPVKDKQ